MKILHILDHSLPLHSGYTFRTASILREQRARGWETLHLTTQRQGPVTQDAEEADGWLFHRTRSQRGIWSGVPVIGPYLQEMKCTKDRLIQLALEHRPDVIHAHSPVLNVLPAIWAGRRLGIPVVYEIRAFWEDAAVDHGTTSEGSLRYRATRALETYAVRNVQAIAVICEGLKGDLESRGIVSGRITVVPNGVDADSFAFNLPQDEELRARLGLEGATVLGFLGSFYAYEGVDLLLRAVANLLPVHPRLRLLLAGGGPEEARLKGLATELGVDKAVTFTGRIAHSDITRYYSLVDLLVLPRRAMRLTHLVTPLKPLEAMALGRVVVASDVGGHRELISDGSTGYLFPAGDVAGLSGAVERALAARDHWDELRANARRFVEQQRSWRGIVARYAPVYGQITRRLPAAPLRRAA
jgi:PEP-CTERM/exosortase A-associated glycosyltransferase